MTMTKTRYIHRAQPQKFIKPIRERNKRFRKKKTQRFIWKKFYNVASVARLAGICVNSSHQPSHKEWEWKVSVEKRDLCNVEEMCPVSPHQFMRQQTRPSSSSAKQQQQQSTTTGALNWFSTQLSSVTSSQLDIIFPSNAIVSQTSSYAMKLFSSYYLIDFRFHSCLVAHTHTHSSDVSRLFCQIKCERALCFGDSSSSSRRQFCRNTCMSSLGSADLTR